MVLDLAGVSLPLLGGGGGSGGGGRSGGRDAREGGQARRCHVGVASVHGTVLHDHVAAAGARGERGRRAGERGGVRWSWRFRVAVTALWCRRGVPCCWWAWLPGSTVPPPAPPLAVPSKRATMGRSPVPATAAAAVLVLAATRGGSCPPGGRLRAGQEVVTGVKKCGGGA
ncbi:hypothetical protein I4F81_008130 [Pyropia yezoensis]|uniref:Uncharacterized protein n=1 Tax=Pyropia yezoensis TaxID=2788 RepID=A0ACC3C6J9_PYRYE|nr:hypothetical protein I4F81_008130 [Neopyropia yezoensis]